MTNTPKDHDDLVREACRVYAANARFGAGSGSGPDELAMRQVVEYLIRETGAQCRAGLTGGVQAIARERQHQLEVHSNGGDDGYLRNELVQAAMMYVVSAVDPHMRKAEKRYRAQGLWPWGIASFKPDSRRRDLERAGALIAAELDRMERSGVES